MAVEGPAYARGECPACGMPIPFSRTIAGRGKSFICRACGREIVLLLNKKAAAGLGVSGLALLKVAGAWALPVILAAIGVLDWRFSKVGLAEANPNPPPASL
jgi:hypothetical protein